YDASNPYLIDLQFWADLLRHGDAFIDADCLAAFRVSGGSVSARIGLHQAALYRRFVRRLRQDGFYGISRFDLALAYMFSFQWCLLRNIFVRSHSARAQRGATKQATDGCCGGSFPQHPPITEQAPEKIFNSVAD